MERTTITIRAGIRWDSELTIHMDHDEARKQYGLVKEWSVRIAYHGDPKLASQLSDVSLYQLGKTCELDCAPDKTSIREVLEAFSSQEYVDISIYADTRRPDETPRRKGKFILHATIIPNRADHTGWAVNESPTTVSVFEQQHLVSWDRRERSGSRTLGGRGRLPATVIVDLMAAHGIIA